MLEEHGTNVFFQAGKDMINMKIKYHNTALELKFLLCPRTFLQINLEDLISWQRATDSSSVHSPQLKGHFKSHIAGQVVESFPQCHHLSQRTGPNQVDSVFLPDGVCQETPTERWLEFKAALKITCNLKSETVQRCHLLPLAV